MTTYTKKDGTVITDEWMEAVAKAAKADKLPGRVLSTQTHSGRPALYENEQLKTISFRLPLSYLSAIENVTKSKGVSRSVFLRDAVEKALAADT
jgi:hypothetical protein